MFESKAPEQAKITHSQKMPGFRQIRPIYSKVLPNIGEAVQGEVEEHPDSSPKTLRSVRRAAFRAAAPLQQENETLAEKTKIAEQEARKDHLTGLDNRRAFEEKLDQAIAGAIRYKHPLSILILDIDKFKDINDRYGHAAGDLALKEFAKILRVQLVRDSDIVARLGGDEFGIILPETNQKQAELIANRLKDYIEKNLKEELIKTIPDLVNQTEPLTSSIGGTEYDGSSREQFTHQTDIALYNSKRSPDGENRRNSITFYQKNMIMPEQVTEITPPES